MAEQIEIVENGEMLDGVSELGQRGQHVCLGRPIHGFQQRAQILVERGRLHGIEQDEDIEFPLHSYFVRLNLPVNKWFITSVVM